jgi:tryptophan synthase alpha chain
VNISECFRVCGDEARSALIPYLTCGFPSASATNDTLDALVENGADVIELGVPFSDPLADGPTIQKTSFDALQGGMTLPKTLEVLADFRGRHASPVVLFSYLNPILRYGVEDFLRDATQAGADGLLLTDLPTGADPELEKRILDSNLDLIRLLAPTTQPERIPAVAGAGQGFLYYISRTGVTGVRQDLPGGLEHEVAALRGVVDLPVAVGFGISTPAQAKRVADVAEGVVVGSALLKVLAAEGPEGAGRFLGTLRRAMDTA